MASCDCVELLTAQTSDFESQARPLIALDVGRIITIWATGNFDGAVVQIEVTSAATPGVDDWLPLRAAFSDATTETEIQNDTSMTFTQPGWRNAQLKARFIRARLTGAGAGTEVTVEVL